MIQCAHFKARQHSDGSLRVQEFGSRGRLTTNGESYSSLRSFAPSAILPSDWPTASWGVVDPQDESRAYWLVRREA